MTRLESRLRPQHRFWDEDLPSRSGKVGAAECFFEEIARVDRRELVISRTSDILRGGGLLFGVVVLVLTALAAGGLGFAVVDLIRQDRDGYLFASAMIVLVVSAGVTAVVMFLRIDLTIPRDTPVRFDRESGKLRAYEFQRTHNPFAKWPTVIKEFDWSTVEAEIHKQAGFNGKAYVVRYSLVLCICKPGTDEVVDRVTLKGNRIVTQDLHALWNYLRLYMRDGPDNLPPVKPLPVGSSFRRSFFEYMPWFDPTSDGRELRAKMPGWLLAFNGIVTVLVLWLVIPMGVCHYIAMKFAPEPKWPGEAQG